MTCPRCGGTDSEKYDDCIECEAVGKCIVRLTRCTTCRFGIANVVWAEGDELQFRGWMTSDAMPDDLPCEVREFVNGKRFESKVVL